ncbi:MAG: geranylgeranylglyceryl/heptaprenylglyceryl phosphate synthase [Bacteroidota bacterium]|nr:geranylgeranylglyceryl/heptaprenylglyceryl phosphate synthase [Bacteroidota bacterium]
MQIYKYLLNTIKQKGAAYLILIDPDQLRDDMLEAFIKHCERSGVDGLLVGGSLMGGVDFNRYIHQVKSVSNLPVIIFPGSESQISSYADAILFISVVSGRNPEHLIGKHVISAPIIRSSNLEPISTGYILIDSGNTTTAQYMSGSLPIPRNKPNIAAATALAAEYLGMKFIYLEGGSGAIYSVPDEIVKAVSMTCTIPVIVGGGIKTPKAARDKIEAGANIIVTGNFFEDQNNWHLVKDFANAIHIKNTVEV